MPNRQKSSRRWQNPVFAAIDHAEMTTALQLVQDVKAQVGGIKIGKEFFTANGPEGVRRLVSASGGLPLFTDLKFHDIPNTVAGAVRAVCALRPAVLNVHIAGGRAMMQAAKAATEEAAPEDSPNDARPPLVIGVTVLTSLDNADLAAIGIQKSTAAAALDMAMQAQDAGLDGVVCSPHEIASIRKRCGDDFCLVVPGIRSQGVGLGDQKRVMTPSEALGAGADILVVGREISAANAPAAAARAIRDAIAA